MKKQMLWKTKGMNQDLSVSAFNPEFSFENMNLRISTNENNTLLSWVNERGTAEIKLHICVNPSEATPIYDSSLRGMPIGTAIIDHKLIVFTFDHNTEQGTPDYIYKLWFDDDKETLEGILLYNGYLEFSSKNPLETLVSYESNEVQKVYWTDYINQPRMINVTKTYGVGYSGEVDTRFDFIPTIEKWNSLSVSKLIGGGLFAPGVIQYCYSYFNKYGQQTNIVDVSPLFYLASNDRGESPEGKVGCSFALTLSELDTRFEYVRIYSIQRTSLDATPFVRIVTDIKIASSGFNYTDTGTTGTSIDPTELLFIGGKEIRALTMTDKDGTLFLGNIIQKNTSVKEIQTYFREHEQAISWKNTLKKIPYSKETGVYPYTNQLKDNQGVISTFKAGDTYRFGIQLQKKTGEWSNPIFLKDAPNTVYPSIDTDKGVYKVAHAEWSCAFYNIQDNEGQPIVDTKVYVNVRPIIVFPSIEDRDVLCQGVLNPTVFNIEDRMTRSPFAQASWYFRPYHKEDVATADGWKSIEGDLEYRHYYSLYSHQSAQEQQNIDTSKNATVLNFQKVEVQGSQNIYETPYDSTIAYPKSNSQFFVDQSIVTLNSPDLEFDTEVQSYSSDGLSLKVIGIIPIDGSASSHSITTSSNMVETGTNLVHEKHRGNIENLGFVQTGWGIGERNIDIMQDINTHSRARLVAAGLWNDTLVMVDTRSENTETRYKTKDDTEDVYRQGYEDNPYFHVDALDFVVHPWNRKGSLNNDPRGEKDASSLLKTKKESNLLFSLNTYYKSWGTDDYEYATNTRFHLQENEQLLNIRLDAQKEQLSSINYYPNIEKVLTTDNPYKPLVDTRALGYNIWINDCGWQHLIADVKDPVEMKYKSGTHAIVALKASTETEGKVPVLPSVGLLGEKQSGKNNNKTFWGDTIDFYQENIDTQEFNNRAFLLLGELCKSTSDNKFGGNTDEAIRNNKWIIGGETVPIETKKPTVLQWTYGDTYYQRYDSLKTYASTTEDYNQLVEILSFMCETRINIEGRYDNNRGQTRAYMMNPTNFNHINPVYSQKNNFFTSRVVDAETSDLQYPNLITYSKTKSSGADVDLWTNVTMASTLELDGDKGKISSLRRFNDQIIAFQDSAISQVLYNENVQISSTEGVPIEIANSGKVQGKRYLSDSIGCSNKWSVCNTPSGIYFMDSNNKGIYLFNGQVNDLSGKLGMNTWAKNYIPTGTVEWEPEGFNNFVTYYDRLNQDVLFISKKNALAFSEKFGVFTSFYDYGDTPYFCNLDDVGIWIRKESDLWKHQAGSEYCKFFDFEKPYWMTLVGNPEPQVDKIFTNLEFRACVDGDGEPNQNASKFTFYTPFDSLETWNEYQHGYTALSIKNGHSLFKHGGNDSALIRKFRIWRCDIPRNNMSVSHKTDRMRNPWLYLKLLKDSDTSKRAEIHDVMMTYFG